MLCAVLTGDIVDSTALSRQALDAAMRSLDHAARDISGWYDGAVTGFARRGGDGWQTVVNRPGPGLRAALYLRACLRRGGRNLETRIAIAEGEGEVPDPDRPDPNAGHGPAFTTSGRLLQRLGGHRLMAHGAGGLLDAVTRLADHVSQGWTEAQARAVAEMLPPEAGPRAAAAQRLGISRQAVDQALWAAGYPALADALTLVEDAA